MGYPSLACVCPTCRKPFKAEWGKAMKMRKEKGRDPCCSKTCEQERRHKESRDRKWRDAQVKGLAKSVPGI